MKKTLLALAAISALTATPALSGNISDPIIEDVLIIEDTTASSSNGAALVVLLALLVTLPILTD